MAEEQLLESSTTSDTSITQGRECVLGKFITEEEGWKIVSATATWEGTPYASVGDGSAKGVGGDCSGITNKSYREAGFPYPYQTTRTFKDYVAKSHQFREIDPAKTPMQAGDILWWPGHMAIYAPFPEGHPKRNTGVVKAGEPQNNDMYTAFNANRDVPYKAYKSTVFRPDKFLVYRYLAVKGPEKCP